VYQKELGPQTASIDHHKPDEGWTAAESWGCSGLEETLEKLMKSYRTMIFSFLAFLMLLSCHPGVTQQLPTERAPVNVAGNWTIYSKGEDGQTATQLIQLQQNGTVLTGHFKGPHQSGGLEGTMDARHIVFRTKTRAVLTFRGMVNGDSMQGDFGIRGKHGTWQATRTQ
jgi:hypothetical protein